ncbi:hypothetical protein BD310DRAFT_920147 [Dichomitus squalens]|uniref:Uncharacterized protein n=1 Tax=Dichomitus squalens TaxID=114155 RepID=A0A4Q9Q4B3_9APHY|nr:hypothetical protein BD310DRAFT_920147 [Dichomitus squalens]
MRLIVSGLARLYTRAAQRSMAPKSRSALSSPIMFLHQSSAIAEVGPWRVGTVEPTSPSFNMPQNLDRCPGIGLSVIPIYAFTA